MLKRFPGIRLGASAAWMVGTGALLASMLLAWLATPPPLLPESLTPVDRVNPLYARGWQLLNQARDSIPPGQSYTVIAADPDVETVFFMLSLGALPDRVARPTTYWRITQPAEGDRARYVVSFECLEPAGRPRLVRRVANGCVWERPGVAR